MVNLFFISTTHTKLRLGGVKASHDMNIWDNLTLTGKYSEAFILLLFKGDAEYPIVSTVLPHSIFQDWVWFLEEKGEK